MKAQSRSSSIPTKRSKRPPENAKGSEVWTVRRAVAELMRHGDRRNVEGMARFGIRAKKICGVSKPQLDEIARRIGKNHDLGRELWETGIHDARLLGMLISDSYQVTSLQMDRWVRDFANWDVCDGTCCHLFVDATPAWTKAFEWTRRRNEFEKRAGFALAAFLAIHDKEASDAPFRRFLKSIEREAWDDRNFVRKAVNWALRNIGNLQASATAERIRRKKTPAGRWIASDALRELRSEAVQRRLSRKES